MTAGLSVQCRKRVGVTPFSNLAVAIWHYAGEQMIGQSSKPLYAQGIERTGGVRINPVPEEADLRKIYQAFGMELGRDKTEKPFSLAFREGKYGEIEKELQLHWHTLPYSRDMLEAYEEGELPRVVILACNPDELWAYAYEIVGLWERFVQDGLLSAKTTPPEIEEHFPLFAPACNGIVMEVFYGFLGYKIKQSEALISVLSSMGGQADAVKIALLSTIFRIGPYQAGGRYESATGELVYKPGGIDHLEVAGGSLRNRTMAKEMLNGAHAVYRRWFGSPPADYATRVFGNPHLMDYLKAMMTININGYAIVLSLQADQFVGVTMGEMADRFEEEIRGYSRAVYNIAQRSGYMASDPINFKDKFGHLIRTLRKNAPHKTSSVRGVEAALAAGKLSSALGPNEVALFNPAICKARQLEMHNEADLLVGLRDKVQETLERLAAGCK